MINYTEKGIGLHDRIAKAGHSLERVNNEWVASDDAAVQAIIDGYSLVDLKAELLTNIDELAKAKRDAVVANISPAEMASWSIKRAEASAYNGQDSSVPFLAAEAAARGVPASALVDKVLAKGAALSGLEAVISGVSGKHCDAIKSAASFSEALSYDYSTGWPV